DRLRPFSPLGGQDRILRVPSFEISGPYDPRGVADTPSRERIFHCYPREASEERACAEQILARLARRAYRRPLSTADVAELMEYYDAGAERGGFEEGTRAGITGVLASPFFLYRAEGFPETL